VARLVTTQAVDRGRLTEPGNSPEVIVFVTHFHWLACDVTVETSSASRILIGQ